MSPKHLYSRYSVAQFRLLEHYWGEEDARKAYGKAFEQLSAVVTILGSIQSSHGGLWSVSMALSSERSRDNTPPSASTQEEFEVSAL